MLYLLNLWHKYCKYEIHAYIVRNNISFMHILSGIYREILSSMNTQRELGVSSFQIVHVYLHYLHLLFLPTQLKLHVTVKNFLQINIIITYHYKTTFVSKQWTRASRWTWTETILGWIGSTQREIRQFFKYEDCLAQISRDKLWCQHQVFTKGTSIT